MNTTYLAAESGGLAVEASGFFLENVWIIPAIMAVSFAIILGFGKRMPRGGSEVGIAAVGVCFVLALLTAGQWIGQVNEAANCTPETCDYIESPIDGVDHQGDAGYIPVDYKAYADDQAHAPTKPTLTTAKATTPIRCPLRRGCLPLDPMQGRRRRSASASRLHRGRSRQHALQQ